MKIAPGTSPKGTLEHGGHPVRPGEDVLRRFGGSAMCCNGIVGPDRRLLVAGRPLPDVLVAVDDVLDQIINRPLRTWRGSAELVRTDVGKEGGERILSALVSN
jgi:hypothetical protein